MIVLRCRCIVGGSPNCGPRQMIVNIGGTPSTGTQLTTHRFCRKLPCIRTLASTADCPSGKCDKRVVPSRGKADLFSDHCSFARRGCMTFVKVIVRRKHIPHRSNRITIGRRFMQEVR